jgi:hypothetical protein
MKKLAILFASMFIMAIAVQNVNAQQEAQETVTAAARIITTLQLENERNIDFGTFTAGNGDITMAAADAHNWTASDPSIVWAGGVRSTGQVDVTGSNNEVFKVTYPASIILTNGTDILTFAPLCNVPNNTTASLSEAGAYTLYFGGTLSILSTSSDGLYTNTSDLVVTVQYE